jgi:hypothetical protein
MKKYFLLLVLLVSSLLFTACQAPDGSEKDSVLSGIFGGGSSDGTTTEEKEVVPQVGKPVADDFSQPLTEMAMKSGLTAEDLQAVRQKLAEGFGMDLAEVQITAESESNPEFMTGYVNVGEGESGGVYFAAKTANGWEVAYNGVGLVYCEIIDQYNFPVGMVPKCYDANTGTSKDRE